MVSAQDTLFTWEGVYTWFSITLAVVGGLAILNSASRVADRSLEKSTRFAAKIVGTPWRLLVFLSLLAIAVILVSVVILLSFGSVPGHDFEAIPTSFFSAINSLRVILIGFLGLVLLLLGGGFFFLLLFLYYAVLANLSRGVATGNSVLGVLGIGAAVAPAIAAYFGLESIQILLLAFSIVLPIGTYRGLVSEVAQCSGNGLHFTLSRVAQRAGQAALPVVLLVYSTIALVLFWFAWVQVMVLDRDLIDWSGSIECDGEPNDYFYVDEILIGQNFRPGIFSRFRVYSADPYKPGNDGGVVIAGRIVGSAPYVGSVRFLSDEARQLARQSDGGYHLDKDLVTIRMGPFSDDMLEDEAAIDLRLTVRLFPQSATASYDPQFEHVVTADLIVERTAEGRKSFRLKDLPVCRSK